MITVQLVVLNPDGALPAQQERLRALVEGARAVRVVITLDAIVSGLARHVASVVFEYP